MELVLVVYKITKKFPEDEKFGIISQPRRAAVSIPSNIAEGRLRGGDVEFRRFLLIAFGSGGELETQLEISKNLTYINEPDYKIITNILLEVMKMLNSLIVRLEAKS